jgi:beta-glucosidase
MIPTSEDQLPTDYLDQSMQIAPGRTHRYFTGKPLYPFGFGLGYSSFSYSNLTVSHTMVAAGAADVDTVLTVSVSVTNNGEYEGSSDEVVMVFAKPTLADAPTSTMSVPKQILGGFTKVATLPGTTTVVSVEVPMRHLRLVGPDDASFGLLRGHYDLHVGGRSPGGGVGMDEGSLPQLLVAGLCVE